MTAKPDTAAAPAVLTVAEFCRKFRLGRTKFQEMKRQGLGPEEVRVGNRILILPEAEARWLAAMVERTRRLEADRFAAVAPAPVVAPARPPQRTFPKSGRPVGRPRSRS